MTARPVLPALLVLPLLAFVPAAARAQRSATAPAPTAATLATIDSLVREFDRAWEPQQGSVEENVARLDRLFVTDSTFLWMADGRPQPDRGRWLEGNRRSLTARAARTDSIRHRTLWSHVRVLDANTIVHNSVYCADAWRKDGSTATSEGASTMLFVRRGAGWRLSTYHGSSANRPVPQAKCPESVPGPNAGARQPGAD